MRILFFFIFFICYLNSIVALNKNEYPVIIIGGGASGTAAALQIARQNIDVLLIEEYSWLGGKLTAAGVSATDGNHLIAGGIWAEFRDSLYARYGGPKAVETGWVSHTLFEPKVGNDIFQNMVKNEKNIFTSFQSTVTAIINKNGKWYLETLKNGKKTTFIGSIIIDATETGEISHMLKLPSDIGMDSQSISREKWAPEKANDIIQDLTYVAILKDFGLGSDHTIQRPDGYDPDVFKCACEVGDPSHATYSLIDCQKMLEYGRLPNDKYMINWPNCGNDFYLHVLNDDKVTRDQKLKIAKWHTLCFVYYLQTELGFKHLGLALGEFPTLDHLPLIPYHRESRRIHGLARLATHHLSHPYDQKEKYYRTGIAVGDYPIDHHHKKNLDAPDIDFINIKVPAYNIPLGSLIPFDSDNIIVAEKNISVTNIVNGTTRLQPVVLGIGQAAGALAAQCILDSKAPSDVSIRRVQNQLLKSDAFIMPYMDAPTSHPNFKTIQKIGATGILKGSGVNYKWANQMWFYPDKTVSEFDLLQGMKQVYLKLHPLNHGSGNDVGLEFLFDLIKKINSELTDDYLSTILGYLGIETENAPLKRYQIALILEEVLNPFEIEITHNGHILH